MADPVTALTPAPLATITASQPLAGLPHTQPSFDPIELLPERAQDLLRKLRQRSVDAHAVIPPFQDISEANAARVEAENALKRLTAHPQDFGHNLPPSDGRVIEARKRLDKLTADARRLTELAEVRSAAWRTTSGPLTSVEHYLRHGVPGNCRLEVIEVEPPKLLKGEAVLDAIQRHRRRVRELKADLARIAAAPFPSAHARAKIRQEVEALAMRGAPVVSEVIEHDGKIVWPMQSLRSSVYNSQAGTVAFAEAPDVLALTCWINRDALLTRLDALIAEEADDPAALTHADRELRAAEVQSDILDQERLEAALIWSAMDQNLPVEFRADINPLALLGLRLVVAPRAAPPKSSPQHSSFNLIGGR